MSGVLTTGVDEAGRGPLAGPVVAAAVILDPTRPVAGLADSKALTPAVRRELAAALRSRALGWSIGLASPAEIDALNILQATLLAMRRAVAGLALAPGHVEIDGNRLPRLEGLPGIV
jgi:ribonuclease HII